MPNSTCRLLSNGYKFDLSNNNRSLILRPCCMFSEVTTIPLDNIDIESIQSYRNQLNLVDSFQHPGCNQCNFFNENFLRKTWRDWSFEIVPDDAELGDASYLELQLDKTCNGGCVICGPHNSSFWQQEVGSRIPSIRQSTDDIVFKILKIVDIKKTRKILFLGGEPLLSRVDEVLMGQIPDPSVVDLQYTINGSVYPSPGRIQRWKKFRSILINFSIDGIKDRFDYIRYPLKWEQVHDNMMRMVKELPDNVRFKINHTINILNLYYHDEFDDWKNRNFAVDRHGNPIPYNFSPAVGVLSPTAVSPGLYDLISNKYPPDSKPFKTIKSQTPDMAHVLNFLRDIDNRRNTNWQQTFPDIADCFHDI